ncbi:MAG: PEP-CTERM sorting domain-containing protein [Nitrospirae bacterium]|nr:PEP-CTERM sorting domain-containing protein [Nitrospirota bacterium]
MKNFIKVKVWGSILTMVATVFVLGAFTDAKAIPTIIHEGVEDLYDSGGTLVTGCSGSGCIASTFQFGNIDGNKLWEVWEKVYYDPTPNTTRYVYTVANDLIADPITSFHVMNGGHTGVGTAPAGWTINQAGGWWIWDTNNSANGITIGTTLNSMTVTLSGYVPVTFSNAKVDYIDGNGNKIVLSSPHWKVSHPVPEPATLLLMGAGLVGLGIFGRKKIKA